MITIWLNTVFRSLNTVIKNNQAQYLPILFVHIFYYWVIYKPFCQWPRLTGSATATFQANSLCHADMAFSISWTGSWVTGSSIMVTLTTAAYNIFFTGQSYTNMILSVFGKNTGSTSVTLKKNELRALMICY